MRLLIVDADVNFRHRIETAFAERGYDVTAMDSLASYRDSGMKDFDFAVIDLWIGSESGLLIMEEIRRQAPSCRVVIVTAYGTIASVVNAIKQGAHHFLLKPCTPAIIEASLFGDGKYQSMATHGDMDDTHPSLARLEREYIETVLVQCRGNRSEAARRLGIHRQSLQRKLRKYPPRK